MKQRAIAVGLGLLLCAGLFAGCSGKNDTGSAGVDSSAGVSNQDTVNAAYENLLSIADVESASGLSGLTAKSELNALKFLDGEGTIVYEARFYDASFYEKEVGGNRKYYSDVENVGDRAAICIPDSPYRLTFVKGGRSVMTQVLARSEQGKYVMGEEQLISLAKIIASRIPG